MTMSRSSTVRNRSGASHLRLQVSEPAVVQAPPRMRHWFIFTLAVLIAFFGMIYSRISLDRDAFVLDELEEKIQVEEARHWDLRLEVARLQAPTRITQMASEMGLVYPTERSDLVVPGVDVEGLDPEYRWAQLRSVLSAQP